MPFSALNQEMPYLDSFVKETARLSPGLIRKPNALPHGGKSDEKFLMLCTNAKPLY